MVIQACQVFSTYGVVPSQPSESDPATPSQVTDPHNNKHIVLRRPHTVLLLATVTGGLAIRGAFTGALADQIRVSDGKTVIYLTVKARGTEKVCKRYRKFETE